MKIEFTETPFTRQFKSGHLQFDTDMGIDGLAKEVGGNEIELLSVHASIPKSGQFRAFIVALKAKYDAIRVLVIMDDCVLAALFRYGFKPIIPSNTTDMEWKKP